MINNVNGNGADFEESLIMRQNSKESIRKQINQCFQMDEYIFSNEFKCLILLFGKIISEN